MKLVFCAMVISESSLAQIAFLDTRGALSIRWKAKPDMEQFKVVYLEALRFVRGVGKIRYYSTDISQIGAFDTEQEAWLSREFYPQVSDCIKTEIFAAVIFSEGHFNALVTNYAASNLTSTSDFIHFNYFTNEEEALDWLSFMQKGQDLVLYTRS